MVCDFTSRPTISPNIEMLHNNILGAIKEMQCRVDIEDEKNNIMHLRRHLCFKLQCLCMIVLWLFIQGQTR
jgi:hypothetical protein